MCSIKILNCVGNHAVNYIEGAAFDPTVRKYRGGEVVASFPFSGMMLSAKVQQDQAEPLTINLDGAGTIQVETSTPQIFSGVDELPAGIEGEETFYIVSALYASACRALGRDTSHLLTMRGTVINDDGQVVGTNGFNRN